MINQDLLITIDQKSYRVGDYVYLFDPSTDQLLANRWSDLKMSRSSTCTDGRYYPLGGGRIPGEESMDALLREVHEETNGLLQLAKDELIPLTVLNVLARTPWRYSPRGPIMHGKQFHLYVAIIDSAVMPPFTNIEVDGTSWLYTWYDRQEVLKNNTYVTVAYWDDFVAKNGHFFKTSS